MADYTKQIEHYLQMELDTIKKIDKQAVNQVMNILEEARERASNIYICGNGGSAATASHFLCDFNKGVSDTLDKKYNFICLNDNIPILMAAANDLGYDKIFEVQLMGKVKKGDLLLAVSGSGNSANVVRAVKYVKAAGAQVIGITGYDGGEVRRMADYSLHVPIDNMQITEDLHMIFDHMMMWILAYGDKLTNGGRGKFI